MICMWEPQSSKMSSNKSYFKERIATQIDLARDCEFFAAHIPGSCQCLSLLLDRDTDYKKGLFNL